MQRVSWTCIRNIPFSSFIHARVHAGDVIFDGENINPSGLETADIVHVYQGRFVFGLAFPAMSFYWWVTGLATVSDHRQPASIGPSTFLAIQGLR